MTTDNLEATLIDDSCFSDIFTMQSQTLDDFEFGLEATNIDSLLELFEEREKRSLDSNLDLTSFTNNNIINNVNKISSSVTVKRETNTSFSYSNNSILISSPKVRKSTISSTEISSKRKGTSLLAKPKKSPSRKSIINISDCDLQSFASCFPQDHDYCLISDDNKIYNKLPDYITTFKNVSQDHCMSNSQETDTFDKIPNYIKGFLNFNDNIDLSHEDFLNKDDTDILIDLDLDEEFIEVSDVFFDDDKVISSESQNEVYSGDDFNSMSDASNSNSSLTTSAETQDSKSFLQDFLSDRHLLPEDIEQNECKSNNSENKQINRKSRSRSREPKSFASSTTRIRRLSTRSSVDSSSQSRSSSCSSCSSCTSYSDGSSNESKVNYKHSNSIIRNDNKGQQFNRKRSLKESYCQNTYQRSKVRPNYQNKNHNEVVNNKINARNSIPNSIKPPINMKKDIEERKIIYVGKIPDGTTKTDIRHWFGRFGSIKEVSIHFRDYGDNYAFVTFYRRCDAYEAIEHANEDSRHPKFDLSFGGRRQFCKTRYEDLDYAEDDASFNSERMDFDSLLRSTQAKLSR